MSDTKALRRYQAGVERALGLFDAKNEWADYIAFLSRLLKALQAAPQGAEIPSKLTLSRCLAQCLRPSLPSGVHQKALEVYATVFSILGTKRLSQELSMYLPGISQTLSFASLSIKPFFLALYDEHILKLPPSSLRPALKAMILSLLPGIEEENSDDFEQTLAIINQVKQIFAQVQLEHLFWQNLFLASITGSTRRLGVLMYLSRYLPKLGISMAPTGDSNGQVQGSQIESTSINEVTTPEPGLLLRCFATGLADEQPLVQRGFLDLLVTHLPLNAATVQEDASARDMDILVSSGMSIVLKRDMGLNRRLWTWFCGSDNKQTSDDESSVDTKEQLSNRTPPGSSKSAESLYFQHHALTSVVRTFNATLGRPGATPASRTRTFRTLISLMDRWVIGGPVVDAIFDDVIEDLRMYQSVAPSQDAFDEVFRSANVFFDSLEPQLIARHLLQLYIAQRLELLEYILLNFNFDDQNLVWYHIPLVALVISDGLQQQGTLPGRDIMPHWNPTQRGTIARICSILVELLPSQSRQNTLTDQILERDSDLINDVVEFYGLSQTTSMPLGSQVPLGRAEEKLLEIVMSAIEIALDQAGQSSTLDPLILTYRKLNARSANANSALIATFIESLSLRASSSTLETTDTAAFVRSSALAQITGAFLSQGPACAVQETPLELPLVSTLVNRLWHCLSPSTPQYHAEATELIWMLRKVSGNPSVVDSTIVSLLNPAATQSRLDEHPALRFGVFWTHIQPRVNTPSTPKVTDQQQSGVTSEHAFMEKVLLRIIDSADPAVPDDPWCAWMTSLSSLSLQYGLVLEAVEQEQRDQQRDHVSLLRLNKLVTLAKRSKALSGELVNPQGPVNAICRWCISLSTRAGSEDHTIVLTALRLLRHMHEGSDYVLVDQLVERLCEHLPRTLNGSAIQSSILDTIQALSSLRQSKPPPTELLSILMNGISSPQVDSNIDKWISLLCNLIPVLPDSVLFARLLKMTETFCDRIHLYFDSLQTLFDPFITPKIETVTARAPERSIANLLAGLEFLLARAHSKRSEPSRTSATSLDGSAADATQLRSRANNRLTVVLCMQDAVKVCTQMWMWRPSTTSSTALLEGKSLSHMSSRLRVKTRRMLEHLIDAEPQECLETLVSLWVKQRKLKDDSSPIMSLLQTLDGARPKSMMPATFNAIYSRTNSAALDVAQRSTLSVDLSSTELVIFLREYAQKLEDDLLEEIWSDCTSFLRDILANPMPHRQVLLRLLEFMSVLCQKMENTNFGEQVRMRRELVDLCARLFTALFTIKPTGFDQSSNSTHAVTNGTLESTKYEAQVFDSGSGVSIICMVLPSMSSLMGEADRLSGVVAGIHTHIMGPTLSSRSFPGNVNQDLLELLYLMSKSSSTTKLWRKEVVDAINHTRFFESAQDLVEPGWMPIVQQLATMDRALMTDFLSRLNAPTSAGLMFGVGATAARTEADRQTKANLRRIAFLLLTMDIDTYTTHTGQILTKIDELCGATPASSPSSGTRGDVYLLLRALCLACTQDTLAGLWPIMNAELRALFGEMTRGSASKLSTYSHLQGAKLLDVLLLLRPDEFQLHEWLFVTDTVDAVYPSVNQKSVAAADLLRPASSDHLELHSTTSRGLRKPWLCSDMSRDSKQYPALLASFFSQLSIRAFEDVYSLEPLDIEACRKDLLSDLFCESE